MTKQQSDTTFLVDELGARRGPKSTTYMDGFRFGLGFSISVLLVLLVLGGLSWALIAALHVH